MSTYHHHRAMNPDIDTKIFEANTQAIATKYNIDPNKPIPAHLLNEVSKAIAAQPSASTSYNAMVEQQAANAKAIQTANAALAKRAEEEGGGGVAPAAGLTSAPPTTTSPPTTPEPTPDPSWLNRKDTPLGSNWILVLLVLVLVLASSCSSTMMIAMT